MPGLDEIEFRGYAPSTSDFVSRRTPMTFTLLAAIPAAMLTAMYFYERREVAPLRARAARSTVINTLRGHHR